jgi:hypothetical protein
MAGTAVVIAADILAAVAAREMALPFTVVALGWVAALLGWAAAIPVAEPAWVAWAVAMEVVTAVGAMEVVTAVVTVEAAAIVETSIV